MGPSCFCLCCKEAHRWFSAWDWLLKGQYRENNFLPSFTNTVKYSFMNEGEELDPAQWHVLAERILAPGFHPQSANQANQRVRVK